MRVSECNRVCLYILTIYNIQYIERSIRQERMRSLLALFIVICSVISTIFFQFSILHIAVSGGKLRLDIFFLQWYLVEFDPNYPEKASQTSFMYEEAEARVSSAVEFDVVCSCFEEVQTIFLS